MVRAAAGSGAAEPEDTDADITHTGLLATVLSSVAVSDAEFVVSMHAV
jgi:hypothetical protein